MENIIFRICRENSGLTPAAVARHLGISLQQYEAIEKGKALITMEQAKQAGVLFHTNPGFLYNTALQTELLNTQRALINALTNEHEILKRSLP
ncbi:MAG: helix-turn-helix domain-containing protein [Ilyomonas sp.]